MVLREFNTEMYLNNHGSGFFRERENKENVPGAMKIQSKNEFAMKLRRGSEFVVKFIWMKLKIELEKKDLRGIDERELHHFRVLFEVRESVQWRNEKKGCEMEKSEERERK